MSAPEAPGRLRPSSARHIDAEVSPGTPARGPTHGVTWTWAGLVAGSVVLSVDYSWASRAPKGDQLHFHLFWLGIFLFLLPATWNLLSPRTRDIDRYLLVVAIGLYSVVPKFLAYPGHPAYFDEYAHWSQVERIMQNGLLFLKNNQVAVIGDYPSLHTLTASIRHLTGLSTYHAGVVLLLALHVTALLGIFAIATRIADSRHVGGIAALFYAIGPGFWFFNTQFAYEAFAFVLFIWSCVGVVHLIRADPSMWNRVGWMIAVLWISFALVGAHHLSSYANLIVLVSFTVPTVVRWIRRREQRSNALELVVLLVAVVSLTGWWFVSQAPNTKSYLSPYLKGGLSGVAGFMEGPAAKDATTVAPVREEPRQLFKGSTIPAYEQISGFAATGLVGVIFAMGVVAQWRRGMSGSLAWGMVLVGCTYFLAYPMILTASGASGARRSWTFTNVGVATVVALGLASIPMLRQWWLRVPGMAVLLGSVVILMVGNVSVNMNEVYRFPGPYIYGSDTRSVTKEITDAARWLRETQGVNQPVIGDRSAQVAFASTGRGILGVPSDGYPLWDFILSPRPPAASLLEAAGGDGLRFIVVDKHQARAIPMIGFYLDQNEPLAQKRTEPLSTATLTKWDQMAYAMRIYASDTIDIYRLDPQAYDLHATVPGSSSIPGEAVVPRP